MKWNNKANTSELCPAGTHVARCVLVADLGSQESAFGTRPELAITWEVLEPDVRRKDGSVFLLSRRFTQSNYEKAAYYRLVSDWLGPDAAADFEPEKLAGKYGLVSVRHHTKGEKTRADVSHCVALPRGAAKPAGVNEPIVYSIADSDDDVLEKLPEWMREAVKASPEYLERGALEAEKF